MPIIRLSQLEQFAAVNLRLDPGDLGGPVVVPQCAQIRLNWGHASGKINHNVLYGRYSGTFLGTQAQANSILSALTTGANWTGLAAFLAPTSFLAGVSIRDVNTANQAIVTSSAAGAPGTSTGTSLPNEVALVVTERTALTGRANRGRIYVPGWATTAIGTADSAAAGAVTALSNWAVNLIRAALSGQGYTLVIGQKARAAYEGSTGTQHPARPAGSVAVTSLEVRDNHWDSQRRRGLK